MKLLVAPYNNGAGTWTEAEETAFLSYELEHQFNAPAIATVVLADPTGLMAQKYNADANDVYIGVGKLTIEDPTATDIFYGRIVKADHDSTTHTLTLTARDWLDQLGDEIVDYDMRVDLDGAGLRQSNLHSDPDSAVHVGPAYSEYGTMSGVLDDGGVFTDDSTDVNDAGANDVAILPAVPVVNDAFLFGFDNTVSGMRLNIGTAAVYDEDVVITWYYSTGAGTWSVLTVTDATTGFTVAGTQNVTWTAPAGWATATYALLTKFWVKAKLTTNGVWTTVPVGTQFWQLTYNVFDDHMAWANDALNDKYLMLNAGMAGNITVGTGPYLATPTTVDNGDGDPEAVWVDDGTPAIFFANNDYSMEYDFRLYVGNDTPTDLYAHGSITAARIYCTYQYNDGATGAIADLQIYDNTAAGWVKLQTLTNDNTTFYNIVINPPGYLLTRIVDATGIVKLRFNVTDPAWGANASISVDYLWVEVHVGTQAYTQPIHITDTVTTNRLYINTDLYTAATQKVWEGVPYSVCAHIHSHINTIVQAGDAQVTLTTNVENTTGVSDEFFEKKSRRDILQELAERDNAVFYLILGGTVVQWLRTTDSTSTAITDANITRWIQGGYDFDRVFNKYDVYGIRIGEGQVSGTDSDATSIAKFRTTKSKMLSGRYLSDADATVTAAALVDRDANPRFTLKAELAGLASERLGDYLLVTSAYLNLTAVAYTVAGWIYNSNEYKTTLTLEPRGTVGYVAEAQSWRTAISQAKHRETRDLGDRYLPDLTTHVVV